MGPVLFSGMKIFPLGVCRGRCAPSVNFAPPHISETTRARKLKFYRHLDGPSTLFRYENFYARDRAGVAAPSVNLGPPHISERIIAIKFKFYTHFASFFILFILAFLCHIFVVANLRGPTRSSVLPGFLPLRRCIMFYKVIIYRIAGLFYFVVTSADPILPFLASKVLYLVLAICVALPYKVQHWTTLQAAKCSEICVNPEDGRCG